MKQSIPVAILTYGNSKTEKIARQTRLPVIDVTRSNWMTQVIDAAYPNPVEESRVQAIGHASAIARKKIPSSAIEVVVLEDQLHSGELPREKKQPPEVAARVDDIVISKRYHPAAEDSRVWLSTHHLELIEKLLSEGFKIEILDQLNNVVRTIE